jgi:hypothetical protein
VQDFELRHWGFTRHSEFWFRHFQLRKHLKPTFNP